MKIIICIIWGMGNSWIDFPPFQHQTKICLRKYVLQFLLIHRKYWPYIGYKVKCNNIRYLADSQKTEPSLSIFWGLEKFWSNSNTFYKRDGVPWRHYLCKVLLRIFIGTWFIYRVYTVKWKNLMELKIVTKLWFRQILHYNRRISGQCNKCGWNLYNRSWYIGFHLKVGGATPMDQFSHWFLWSFSVPSFL